MGGKSSSDMHWPERFYVKFWKIHTDELIHTQIEFMAQFEKVACQGTLK